MKLCRLLEICLILLLKSLCKTINFEMKVEIWQGVKYLVNFTIKYFIKMKSFGKLRGIDLASSVILLCV